MRRVVVTGLGAVTPLAANVPKTWRKLVQGQCAIRTLSDLFPDVPEYSMLSSQVAAAVPHGSEPDQFDFSRLDYEQKSRMSPFMEYGLMAASEALVDAEWIEPHPIHSLRTGVCVGSGFSSVDTVARAGEAMQKQKPRKISPYFVLKISTNQTAGHISMKYGFKGVNHSVSTACATGAHSIGDAMRFIQYGDADVIVAGGTEACITPLGMIGFCRAKALSTRYNDRPQEASRPFDKDRDGFVMGEGAGMMVLEEYEHAKKRGARIYAEIKGYGLTGDAFHATTPPSTGEGAARAMLRALEIGSTNPDDIDYLNCHATSTPQGDRSENEAIRQVFGIRPAKLAVSSTKGAIGHLLGAAGAVEAVFTVLALYHGILPPTVNLNAVEDHQIFTLDYIKQHAREVRNIKYAMTNSSGFGGTNTSLLFKKM